MRQGVFFHGSIYGHLIGKNIFNTCFFFGYTHTSSAYLKINMYVLCENSMCTSTHACTYIEWSFIIIITIIVFCLLSSSEVCLWTVCHGPFFNVVFFCYVAKLPSWWRGERWCLGSYPWQVAEFKTCQASSTPGTPVVGAQQAEGARTSGLGRMHQWSSPRQLAASLGFAEAACFTTQCLGLQEIWLCSDVCFLVFLKVLKGCSWWNSNSCCIGKFGRSLCRNPRWSYLTLFFGDHAGIHINPLKYNFNTILIIPLYMDYASMIIRYNLIW